MTEGNMTAAQAMPGTALVLGATGGIGGEVAAAMLRRGWRVRALVRNPAKAAAQWQRAGVAQPQWVAGDAMDAASVCAAAHGARVIVHAVNPPGYRHWERLAMPMMESTLAAARATGARIVLPGTVYNYGPDALAHCEAGGVVAEGAAQRPATRKGGIRVQMEARLEHAAAQEGVRTLVVRAGDFFGPHCGNSWFAQGLVKPGRVPASVVQPGRAGIGHQWAYLPDVAETMLRLLERESELGTFARFHMQGHWDADGIAMVRAVQRAVATRTGHAPRLAVFPWWAVGLASPVVPLFRALREMRYVWRQPLRLDNARLLALLDAEPHTPLDDAIAATLSGLGCLPEAAAVHAIAPPAQRA